MKTLIFHFVMYFLLLRFHTLFIFEFHSMMNFIPSNQVISYLRNLKLEKTSLFSFSKFLMNNNSTFNFFFKKNSIYIYIYITIFYLSVNFFFINIIIILLYFVSIKIILDISILLSML